MYICMWISKQKFSVDQVGGIAFACAALLYMVCEELLLNAHEDGQVRPPLSLSGFDLAVAAVVWWPMRSILYCPMPMAYVLRAGHAPPGADVRCGVVPGPCLVG
eukprot:3936369-Rhodomonas_salina.1